MARRFVQKDVNKKKRLKEKWRKGRGHDSKVRLNFKGYIKAPQEGFRSPLAVRGKIDGLTPVIVSNAVQLNSLTSQNIAIFSSSLGARSRVVLAKIAMERKIPVENMQNPQSYLEWQSKLLEDRKKARSELLKKKESKKEKKVDKKVSALEETLSEEDKKKAEKMEMDKVLTKKELQ